MQVVRLLLLLRQLLRLQHLKGERHRGRLLQLKLPLQLQRGSPLR